MSAESLRGTDTRAKVTQTTDAYGPGPRAKRAAPRACTALSLGATPPHSVSSIATIAIPIDSRQARASSGRSPHPAPPAAPAATGTSRTPESST